MSARRIFARPARFAAIAPYVWMVLFFLVPFAFVLKISLSQTAIAQPPYTPVFDFTAGSAAIKQAFGALSLDNFRLLVSDNLYVFSYLRSLVVAVTSTAILLVIGYPIAYGMARLPQRWQPIAMMLVIVPFWTSFLIRIYAWINILQHDGLLNKILLALHLVSQPVVWLSTDSAMYLGIVYSYLPFMILPLYATLSKMDPALEEAAADLGASPKRVFWLVTFPLSLPGVGAGVLVVLHPDRRRVRDPRSARRLQFADDRPDAVAGVLHQQGLAGGLRHRDRAAGAADRAAAAVRPAAAPAIGGAVMAQAVACRGSTSPR